MAYRQTDQTISRKGLTLPTEISTEIWQNAQHESAIMRLARRVDLPSGGVSIPLIVSDPEAEWTKETHEIKVGNQTVKAKELKPYKVGVIETFSVEFLNDFNALYEQLVLRLPQAIAKKFDQTVLAGATKPGENFDQLHECEAVDIQKDGWKGLIDARAKVAENGGILNGWALAPQAEAVLLNQTDKNGRPLFVDAMAGEVAVPRLAGANAFTTRGAYIDGKKSVANTIGFGGDWTNAAWGMVNDIQFSVTEDASINVDGTVIHLFQSEMFAVRVTAELGFVIDDKKKFVRLTDTKA